MSSPSLDGLNRSSSSAGIFHQSESEQENPLAVVNDAAEQNLARRLSDTLSPVPLGQREISDKVLHAFSKDSDSDKTNGIIILAVVCSIGLLPLAISIFSLPAAFVLMSSGIIFSGALILANHFTKNRNPLIEDESYKEKLQCIRKLEIQTRASVQDKRTDASDKKAKAENLKKQAQELQLSSPEEAKNLARQAQEFFALAKEAEKNADKQKDRVQTLRERAQILPYVYSARKLNSDQKSQLLDYKKEQAASLTADDLPKLLHIYKQKIQESRAYNHNPQVLLRKYGKEAKAYIDAADKVQKRFHVCAEKAYKFGLKAHKFQEEFQSLEEQKRACTEMAQILRAYMQQLKAMFIYAQNVQNLRTCHQEAQAFHARIQKDQPSIYNENNQVFSSSMIEEKEKTLFNDYVKKIQDLFFNYAKEAKEFSVYTSEGYTILDGLEAQALAYVQTAQESTYVLEEDPTLAYNNDKKTQALAHALEVQAFVCAPKEQALAFIEKLQERICALEKNASAYDKKAKAHRMSAQEKQKHIASHKSKANFYAEKLKKFFPKPTKKGKIAHIA